MSRKPGVRSTLKRLAAEYRRRGNRGDGTGDCVAAQAAASALEFVLRRRRFSKVADVKAVLAEMHQERARVATPHYGDRDGAEPIALEWVECLPGYDPTDEEWVYQAEHWPTTEEVALLKDALVAIGCRPRTPRAGGLM